MRSMLAATAGLVLASTLAFTLSIDASAQKPPVFQFTGKPGPHAVGLKVIDQYDYSRTFRSRIDVLGKPFTGERARPIQTLIWYPAEKSSSKPMTVADYIDLLATETPFDHHTREDEIHDKRTGLAPTLATTLWAVRDAPLENGHFPLVIYAPSFSASSWENADLCEFLASYGYVVVAGTDMGAATRAMTPDLEGVRAQARDISFLIGYAQSLPDADISEIAVAGFSWGGISNLFAASQDNRIDALVCLDGSMRYYPGIVKRGEVHPEEMTLPMIFFTQGEFTLEDQEHYLKELDSPNVLNSWTHGDLTTVHMLGMAHGEFNSENQRDEGFWKDLADFQKADYGREDGITGYAWVAQYTLQFLDAYLKHDAAALAYLKRTPAENGVPKHFLSTSYRAAQSLPPSMERFRKELGAQGFDHSAEVYAALRKEKPDFTMDEAALENWGRELIVEKHLPEAIDLFKLNLQLHPDVDSAYLWLADTYMEAGQKQSAIETDEALLKKNPDNAEAKEKLKKWKDANSTAK